MNGNKSSAAKSASTKAVKKAAVTIPTKTSPPIVSSIVSPIPPATKDAFFFFIGLIDAVLHNITNQASECSAKDQTITGAHTALRGIKTALLNADQALGRILSANAPTVAQSRAAWAAFDKAYNDQATPFYNAINTLQANAAEWSQLDLRLNAAIQAFKKISNGGNPTAPISSWGGAFSSGAPSSQTSIAGVP
jgi:hypothetical protein